MPGLSVRFYAGTKAQYDALQSKDQGGIYFITDKKTLYKGNEVISRYSVTQVPSATPNSLPGVRITDLHTGATYDIPLLSGVEGLIENNMMWHYSESIIQEAADMVSAINGSSGQEGTGEFLAGTVYRVESRGVTLELNPGQFAKPDNLVANDHDLVVALYSHAHDDSPFRTNKSMFAVIPTDLINLVTANVTLDNNKVVVGAGNKTIKTIPFNGAGKILATNQSNDGVEWLSPETVQSDLVWEDIAGA